MFDWSSYFPLLIQHLVSCTTIFPTHAHTLPHLSLVRLLSLMRLDQPSFLQKQYKATSYTYEECLYNWYCRIGKI